MEDDRLTCYLNRALSQCRRRLIRTCPFLCVNPPAFSCDQAYILIRFWTWYRSSNKLKNYKRDADRSDISCNPPKLSFYIWYWHKKLLPPHEILLPRACLYGVSCRSFFSYVYDLYISERHPTSVYLDTHQCYDHSISKRIKAGFGSNTYMLLYPNLIAHK
jgi:hypothetical protein